MSKVVEEKTEEVDRLLDDTAELSRAEYRELLEEVIDSARARIQVLDEDGED